MLNLQQSAKTTLLAKFLMGLTFITILTVFQWPGAAAAMPEDSIRIQSCHELVKSPNQIIPHSVPQELCIQSYKIDATQFLITIQSYSHAEMFRNFVLTELEYQPNGGAKFEATKQISKVWEAGCGAGEIVVLKITGQVTSEGSGSGDELGIDTNHVFVQNTCNTKVQTTRYKYLLK